MRWAIAVFALIFLTGTAAAKDAVIVPGKVYTWDSRKNGAQKTYRAETLTLHFQAQASGSEDDATKAVLTITEAGGPTLRYRFESGFETPSVQFFVGRLDPANPHWNVVLARYSGGAHCCLEKDVFIQWQGAWRRHEIDSGTETGEIEYPKDVDGDGVPDFVLFDDRFAYRFGCFACSWMPPQIFYLQGNRVIDGTASGKYTKLLEADLAKAKNICTGNDPLNGLCAGVAADGARLHRFKDNWRWLVQHYPRQDDWAFPDGCAIDISDGTDCPADQVLKFKNFPQSLAWFLRRTGYISRAEEAWATAQADQP